MQGLGIVDVSYQLSFSEELKLNESLCELLDFQTLKVTIKSSIKLTSEQRVAILRTSCGLSALVTNCPKTKKPRISELSIELRWSVNCYRSSAAASEETLLLSTATPPASTREIHNYGLIDASKALVARLISQFWRKRRLDSPFRSPRKSFCSCRWLRTASRWAASRCFRCPMASPGSRESKRIIKFEFPIPKLSHQMKIYSHKLTPDAVWVTEHRQSRSNGH